MDASATRIYLHIGLQKTGTSFLQDALFNSAEELARQGLDMVPDSRLAAFHLMLRVRNRYDPAVDPPDVARALDRFRVWCVRWIRRGGLALPFYLERVG